jgi:hypothetical protein
MQSAVRVEPQDRHEMLASGYDLPDGIKEVFWLS